MDEANTGRAVHSGPLTIVRVFAPFTAAYLLSELYRNVNAVAGPPMQAELALGAGDLGLLTAVFLGAIAAAQLPVGVLLDHVGPRRVLTWLMWLAVAGSLLFAFSGFAGLVGGRLLIGLGMAACWTGAYKANASWFPPERLALANGATLGLAGLGALAATLPVELLLRLVSWREMFLLLAAATVGLILIIRTVVPRDGAASAEALEPGDGFRRILRDPVFLRTAPVSFLCQGAWLAYQGLWAGPWLREVGRLAPVSAASVLMTLALAIVVGQILLSLAADRLTRYGVPLATVMAAVTGLFVGIQALILLDAGGGGHGLWAAYGLFTAGPIFAYALVAAALPGRLAGRAIGLLNLLSVLAGFVMQYGIGLVIELWPAGPGGIYPPEAHRSAMAVEIAIQAAALAWMLLPGFGGSAARQR